MSTDLPATGGRGSTQRASNQGSANCSALCWGDRSSSAVGEGCRAHRKQGDQLEDGNDIGS